METPRFKSSKQARRFSDSKKPNDSIKFKRSNPKQSKHKHRAA